MLLFAARSGYSECGSLDEDSNKLHWVLKMLKCIVNSKGECP